MYNFRRSVELFCIIVLLVFIVHCSVSLDETHSHKEVPYPAHTHASEGVRKGHLRIPSTTHRGSQLGNGAGVPRRFDAALRRGGWVC